MALASSCRANCQCRLSAFPSDGKVQSKHSGFQVPDSVSRDEEEAEKRGFHLVEALFLTADSERCTFNIEFSVVTTTNRALCFCIAACNYRLACATDTWPRLKPPSHLPWHAQNSIELSVFRSQLFQKWGVGSMVLPLLFFLKWESDLNCNTCLNMEHAFRNQKGPRSWLSDHVFIVS